jgi:hypothetical protein
LLEVPKKQPLRAGRYTSTGNEKTFGKIEKPSGYDEFFMI